MQDGSPGRGVRGPYAVGARRREAILDAAIELWAEAGSNGAGLAAIARRAGTTHSVVLHHFGSKSNLLVEVIAERQRRSAAAVEEAFAGGGIEALRNIPRYAELSAAEPALARLLHVLIAENLDAAAPAHRYFVARQRSVVDRLARTLGDAQAAGVLRGGFDPVVKASEIIAFVDGAHVQWLLDPDRVSLAQVMGSYTEALLRDLATDAEQAHP